MRILLVAILTAWAMSACGVPYRVAVPDSMIELNESRWSQYSMRATTPDAVVFAVRTIRQGDNADVPRGDLDFWTDALDLRMRTIGGYALLETVEVTSADGTDGVQLRFGHDQETVPYVYNVTIFVTDRFVHVIEAGGERDAYDEQSGSIDSAVASYRVKR
jgi:hypothetical protein